MSRILTPRYAAFWWFELSTFSIGVERNFHTIPCCAGSIMTPNFLKTTVREIKLCSPLACGLRISGCRDGFGIDSCFTAGADHGAVVYRVAFVT